MGGDNLGERIRKARERARLTQLQLAEKVGVDRKTVDNWENGRARPRTRMTALEDVLGPHGFSADGSPPTAAASQPVGHADGVVRMVIEILESAFSPGVQVQMIRDVIEREYRPQEPERDDAHERPTG